MHSLAFDPAARYSGAALLDPEGMLVKYWTCDFGALDKGNPQTNLRVARQWASKVLGDTRLSIVNGLWITVENVSHYMTNPAPALRTQGVLLDVTDQHFQSIDPVLVLPAEWQNRLGWKKSSDSKFTSKTWAKWLCESLGYVVEPTPGSKASEDARDAVLIAKWRQVMEADRVP